MQPTTKKEDFEEGFVKYRCQNCGGALIAISESVHKCGFCGAKYIMEDVGGYTRCRQVISPCANVLRVSQYVIHERAMMADKEDVARFAKERILHDLAESLVPYIVFNEEFDEFTMEHRFTGTLRVLGKDFRF